MFFDLFYELKSAKVPVSLKEYLTLLEAMEHNIAEFDVNNFYYLSVSYTHLTLPTSDLV